MAASTELFLAHGFEGASMDAISARAGVPKSTLYKRFPDKRALLAAVLMERQSAWSEISSRRNWMLTESLEQRLKTYACWMLSWATSPEMRAFSRLAKSAWGGEDQIGNLHVATGYARRVEQIEQEIRERGPAEDIVANNPRQVAVALMAMLSGWLELWGPEATVPEAEATKFAHSAVDLLLKGKAAW
jgi:TetR/AcrR family transcriptional repressor of mexJK operon